jgi:hypothetical protein
MNHQDLYKLLVTVQKNVRCPQCGKPYDFALIQIRGIVDSLVFLELNCSSHMPLLATVSIAKQSKKPAMVREEITSDDVIETYKLLKNFNGSFEQLFGENKEKNNTNK